MIQKYDTKLDPTFRWGGSISLPFFPIESANISGGGWIKSLGAWYQNGPKISTWGASDVYFVEPLHLPCPCLLLDTNVSFTLFHTSRDHWWTSRVTLRRSNTANFTNSRTNEDIWAVLGSQNFQRVPNVSTSSHGLFFRCCLPSSTFLIGRHIYKKKTSISITDMCNAIRLPLRVAALYYK